MSKKPTLIKAYELITREKRPYCFLCFSTDKETKLKIPKPSLKAVTKLGNHKSLHDEPPHICYMCERLALSAVRFQKATFFAMSIDIVFKGMLDSWNYCEEIVKFLGITTPPKAKDKDRYETIISYEKQLNTLRSMTRLERSEILVVGNTDSNSKDSNTNSFARPPKSSAKRQKEKERPRRSSTPEDPLEDDIIVLDDIDTTPTKKNKTEEPPKSILEQTLTQNPVTIRIPSNGPDCPVNSPAVGPKLVPLKNLMGKLPNQVGYLHPIVVENGALSVPTLQAKIVDGQVIYTQKENNIIVPDIIKQPYLTVQSEAKEKTYCIVNDNDGKISLMPTGENSFEFSITSSGEGTPVNVGNVGEGTHTGNLAKLTHVSNIANVGTEVSKVYSIPKIINLELENMNNISITKVTSGAGEGSLDKVSKEGIVSCSDKPSSVKEPLLKNDRIDWEDKIPMDVISFMDATDPHPPPFIKPLAPPSVGIYNVRSLRDNSPNTGQTDEIIDLC